MLMVRIMDHELELTQLLCCMRLPLQKSLVDVGLHDPLLPKNAKIEWVTSKHNVQLLLDHINRLSVEIGKEYSFVSSCGEVKKGILRHKTKGGKYYIDSQARKTSHVCEWKNGTFVEHVYC